MKTSACVPPWPLAAYSKQQQLGVAQLFGLVNPSGYIKVDPLGGVGLTGAITFGESGTGRFLCWDS